MFTAANAQKFFEDAAPYVENERDGREFAEVLKIMMMPITEGALNFNPKCEGMGDIIQSYATMTKDHPEETLQLFSPLVMKTKAAQASVQYLQGLLIAQYLSMGVRPEGGTLFNAITEGMSLMEQGIVILAKANSYLQE